MAAKNNNEESITAGYPRIEKLIESEDFDAVNQSFAKSFDELAKIAKQKSGLGKGKAAKRAMRSYELTMDLFKELLKLKYQMLEALKKEAAKST
ncbi:MAG TPA: hypothetical protein DF383_02560 [Deltaproteobacteria bacterium]|nr:hypothetical protein [Deltaproteobacteria bacterium]